MADDKTFTQAEMDSIIEGRLARERQKYADYDDLKEKASKYDERFIRSTRTNTHSSTSAVPIM